MKRGWFWANSYISHREKRRGGRGEEIISGPAREPGLNPPARAVSRLLLSKKKKKKKGKKKKKEKTGDAVAFPIS